MNPHEYRVAWRQWQQAVKPDWLSQALANTNPIAYGGGVSGEQVMCVKRTIGLYVTSLVLASMLFSCATDEAARYYGDVEYASRPPEDVDILYAAPTRPYAVLADIQAYNVSPAHMQRRAAEIGADAVIIVPAGGAYSQSEVWAGQDRYHRTYTRLLATAIRYR